MPSDVNPQHSGEATTAFKVFPEFSRLSFASKRMYESFTATYPPIANISFAMLMTWWNTLDSSAVSVLENNLVISYWVPGMDKSSGLCLVGAHKVDESMCALFDHLIARGESARVVHVPEFVIEHMQHPELFSFSEERHHDEYVYALSKFYPLHHAVSFKRHRLKRFQASVGEERITIKSLELSDKKNRQLLLNSVDTWKRPGAVNNFARHNDDAIKIAITHSVELGLENICLFIDEELHSYILYYLPTDKRYIVASYVRVNNAIPHTLDYAAYAFAKWFSEAGHTYINLEADLGLPLLRILKLALGPSNFFRLYTIEPAARARDAS